jgi:VWFA-related protein
MSALTKLPKGSMTACRVLSRIDGSAFLLIWKEIICDNVMGHPMPAHLVLILLVPLLLLSQDTPRIRSTTRLVNVNVVVADRKGNPVEDLRKEDFAVFDNASPVQVSFFSVESHGAAGTAKLTELQLPADAVSNAVQRGIGYGAVTAVLLDWVNTQFSDLTYAKQQFVEFLRQIRPTDKVGVYVLGRNLRILNEYTNEAESLVGKLSKEGISFDVDPPLVDPHAWTFMALEAIAHHLSGHPGRKNLIWVSSFFPLVDDGGTSPNLNLRSIMETRTAPFRNAVLALNGADIAVFPVYARGLSAQSAFQWDTPAGPMATDLTVRGAQPPYRSFGASSAMATMAEFARETGGKAFFDNSDLKNAIRRVVDGSRVSYSLGFYPSSLRGKGAFHKISVRVNRRGVSPRYRRGYIDREENSSPEDPIRTVLSNRIEATGLEVVARAMFVGTGKIQAEVRVASAGVAMGEDNGRRVAVLECVLVPMDDHGTSYAGVMDTITVPLDEQRHESFLQRGVLHRRTMDLDARAAVLRIVVRDRVGHVVGSVSLPVNKIQKAQPVP